MNRLVPVFALVAAWGCSQTSEPAAPRVLAPLAANQVRVDIPGMS